MTTSKQCLDRLFNRFGLILFAATAGLSLCGGCAGLGRHQPIACFDCARASHDCHCQQVQSAAPVAATGAQVQKADPVAFVPPPTTPAPKVMVRPALIQTKAKTTKTPQSNAPSLPELVREPVAGESAGPDSAAANPQASSSRISPISRNAASMQDPAIKDPILAATDDAKSFLSIEDAPAPPALDAEIPSAKPSNTLIMEIDDVELSNPESNDQGQSRPAQAIPKLKAIVDSEFSAALQMSGRDDPQATVANTQRIMFAVPPLRPSNIPPIVRFVKNADSSIAKNQRQPYSLTTAPALPGTQVRPIEPVLEGLRIGRPITPSPNAATIQR